MMLTISAHDEASGVITKKRKLPGFMKPPNGDSVTKMHTGPPLKYPGTVMYINNVRLANNVCQKVLKEARQEDLKGEGVVYGFDIEWRVTFKAGDVR